MKTHWTEEQLETLKQNISAEPDWGELASLVGRSVYAVRAKALRTGCFQPRRVKPHKAWRDEQRQMLLELSEMGCYTLSALTKRLESISKERDWPIRTQRAIQFQLANAGISYARQSMSELLTIPTIAVALGHSTPRIVRRWVEEKWIEARNGNSSSDPYLIECRELVNFALNNPSEITKSQTTSDGYK
jgi:hypothetical protein